MMVKRSLNLLQISFILLLQFKSTLAAAVGEIQPTKVCSSPGVCVIECDPTHHLELLLHNLRSDLSEKNTDLDYSSLNQYFDFLNKVRACQISNDIIPAPCSSIFEDQTPPPPGTRPIGANLLLLSGTDMKSCQKQPGIKLKDGNYWGDGCLRKAVCTPDCDPESRVKGLATGIKNEFEKFGEISPKSETVVQYIQYINKVRTCQIATQQVPKGCEVPVRIGKNLNFGFELEVNIPISPVYPEGTNFTECNAKPGIKLSDKKFWGTGCDLVATCRIHEKEFGRGGQVANSNGFVIANTGGRGQFSLPAQNQRTCKTVEKKSANNIIETQQNSDRAFVLSGTPYSKNSSILISAVPTETNDPFSSSNQIRAMKVSI
ncbi:MAG: hypothetical protein AABZ55_08750, partial [Bdellovibrionota bacterium]